MIEQGARPLAPQHWAGRPRVYKALVWIAYGIVRVRDVGSWATAETMVPRGFAKTAADKVRADEAS